MQISLIKGALSSKGGSGAKAGKTGSSPGHANDKGWHKQTGPASQEAQHPATRFFAKGEKVTVKVQQSYEQPYWGTYKGTVQSWNKVRSVLRLSKMLRVEGERDEKLRCVEVGAEIWAEGQHVANITELDAEWHRDQPWSSHSEYLQKLVIHPLQDSGFPCPAEVWGWLPASESEFSPSGKGGDWAPLWRIMYKRSDVFPRAEDLEEQ